MKNTVCLELTITVPPPPDTWHASLERQDTREHLEFERPLDLLRYLERLEPAPQKGGLR